MYFLDRALDSKQYVLNAKYGTVLMYKKMKITQQYYVQ